MHSHTLAITRFANHHHTYPQLKDPSVVALPDGSYAMYATLCGRKGAVAVGRFVAEQPEGPWRELSPVRFHHLNGPELCAPAVRLDYDQERGKYVWEMYIQTSCFKPGGVIALAESEDGCNFYGRREPVLTRASLEPGAAPIVGLYDAGISQLTVGGETAVCLLFSGYSALGKNARGRFVGVGDLYQSLRFAGGAWTPGRRILAHEELPFHNQRDAEHYEWGLEGAKLVQLEQDQYLLVGVCFLDRPRRFAGQRQRVFMAASASPFGPFVPVGEPLEPETLGETGHPDVLILEDRLVLIHQERLGQKRPWHLRHRDYPLTALRRRIAEALGQATHPPLPVAPARPVGEAGFGAHG